MGIRILTAVVVLSCCMHSCGSEPAIEPAAKEEPTGPISPEEARNLFILHCESCHGMDGKKGLSEAADLSVSKLTDDEIRNMIENGNDKGMMPYKDIITTDREMEGMVEFVKSLRTMN